MYSQARTPRPSRARRAAAVAVAVLLSSCGAEAAAPAEGEAEPAAETVACPVLERSELRPASGVWFGASIDWDDDSLAGYAERLGVTPAAAVTFASYPMSASDVENVDAAVDQLAHVGAVLVLTLEPHRGLHAVTPDNARELARRLDAYNREGVPVLVRFAHEMNGSWYPWSQQPGDYVAAFRTVAAAVHRHAPGSAMMWAPNYGGGYPFLGGRYGAVAGSGDARMLDTDGDGRVTADDDPYAPYYPGDDAVDWVGMSLYHWGHAYPWGDNEVPEDGKFEALLTGGYHSDSIDERHVPDFYAEYGERRGKPVAIPETAALYVPSAGGPSALEVKQAWWEQVFVADLAERFPALAMINWFEWDKFETEVDARVDWTVTRAPGVRERFGAALPDWMRFGPVGDCRA